MMKYNYVITFLGKTQFGPSYEESIEISCPYDFSNLNEVESLFYLINNEIKKHFSSFKILSVEIMS